MKGEDILERALVPEEGWVRGLGEPVQWEKPRYLNGIL